MLSSLTCLAVTPINNIFTQVHTIHWSKWCFMDLCLTLTLILLPPIGWQKFLVPYRHVLLSLFSVCVTWRAVNFFLKTSITLWCVITRNIRILSTWTLFLLIDMYINNQSMLSVYQMFVIDWLNLCVWVIALFMSYFECVCVVQWNCWLITILFCSYWISNFIL